MPSVDPDTLKQSLLRFYHSSKAVEDKLFDIFKRASCRLIEHFVTKYAQDRPIIVSNIETGGKQKVSLYDSYRLHLDAFNKKYFDPTARGDKIQYDSPFEKRHLITTLGQLNFFKWLICYQIIDQLEKHKEKVKCDSKAPRAAQPPMVMWLSSTND